MLGHAETYDQQLEARILYVVERLRALNKSTTVEREEHCALLRDFEQLLEVKVQQGRMLQTANAKAS